MSGKTRYHADARHVSDLKDLLSQSSELFGQNYAFKLFQKNNGYKYITFNEFKSDVDGLGTALLNLGLKDNFISLIGENRYEWCVSYLSVVNGTGIIVPLDKELPVAEIDNLIERSKSSAIIFSGKHLKEMKEVSESNSNVKFFINMDADEDADFYLSYSKLVSKGKELIASGDTQYLNSAIDNEKMNMLLFTSGTTDLAKGVMLSHKNICSDIMAITSCLYIDDTDSALSILPLHHTYECTAGFLVMVYNGCCITFCEGLKYIGKNIKEIQPSIVMLVPLILEGVYKKIWDTAKKKPFGEFALLSALAISKFLSMFGIDVREKLFKSVHHSLGGNLRLVISGAAGLAPHVSKGFRDFGLNVIQGYGLTECSPIVSVNRDEDFRHDSIGLPISGVEVKLDNVDYSGIGEIIVKGDIVMLGYFENPIATRKVLKNGWLYTGDLGTIDPDGFIRITGRKKSVIVTKNGKNVFPEEVEAYLSKSKYILESLVTGELDEESGETIVSAQIFPDYDNILAALKVDNVDSNEVFKIINAEVKKINKTMPLYKHVKNISIREYEFEKTTSKKIKRYGQQAQKIG